jgi:hypothetical protein
VIYGLHLEVALALAYAAFLVCLASALELLARRSHQRARDYRNHGFVYFRDLDYFECPAGHQLIQISIDHPRRAAVYRAQPGACNSCSLKLNCTDSEVGRSVERRWDSWIESELRRFHRGVSLILLFLATAFLMAELIRYPQPKERSVLLSLLLPLLFAQIKLLSSLRSVTTQN